MRCSAHSRGRPPGVENRAGQPLVDFSREIQPIFKQYCAECHGPSKARGRLRLHTPDLILRGGLSGSPITPGKSEESLLIRRVMGLDGEDQMPLDGEPLPEATIARLRAWIDQGAPMAGMPAHWRRQPGRTSRRWNSRSRALGVREAQAAGAPCGRARGVGT